MIFLLLKDRRTIVSNTYFEYKHNPSITTINQTPKTRLAILSIAIAFVLFAGLAIVLAIHTITPAFGESPFKDNPIDDDNGGGNDPPKKHHKNNGND